MHHGRLVLGVSSAPAAGEIAWADAYADGIQFGFDRFSGQMLGEDVFLQAANNEWLTKPA